MDPGLVYDGNSDEEANHFPVHSPPPVKSLIKEVGDFDKLADMGTGVMEIQGLKVDITSFSDS